MKSDGKINHLIDWQKVNSMVLKYQENQIWIMNNKYRRLIYKIVLISIFVLIMLLIRYVIIRWLS